MISTDALLPNNVAVLRVVTARNAAIRNRIDVRLQIEQ
jgi:hypothetical protein